MRRLWGVRHVRFYWRAWCLRRWWQRIEDYDPREALAREASLLEDVWRGKR